MLASTSCHEIQGYKDRVEYQTSSQGKEKGKSQQEVRMLQIKNYQQTE